MAGIKPAMTMRLDARESLTDARPERAQHLGKMIADEPVVTRLQRVSDIVHIDV